MSSYFTTMGSAPEYWALALVILVPVILVALEVFVRWWAKFRGWSIEQLDALSDPADAWMPGRVVSRRHR